MATSETSIQEKNQTNKNTSSNALMTAEIELLIIANRNYLLLLKLMPTL